MINEWTKAERTVLEKITLAALAVHWINGIEKRSYSIAEVRGYWTSAKSDPGAYTDVCSAENWRGTTLNIWELVRDAEGHFEQLEAILTGESATLSKASDAFYNEWQTMEEQGHVPNHDAAISRAWINAASYAAEIGEASNHELECTVEQLRSAITKLYGYKGAK
jgi:hypothetical protein